MNGRGLVVKLKSRLSAEEKTYLQMGLRQPGGKLPLFDGNGQEIDSRTIKACLKKGFAVRWIANPLKPDWLVCRLTVEGREALRS